jgi:hypothetical protein
MLDLSDLFCYHAKLKTLVCWVWHDRQTQDTWVWRPSQT